MVSLPEALELARGASRAGEFARAESIYRQILQALPDEAALWHELALVLHAAGRSAESAACLERAATLNPRDAAILSNLGVSLQSQMRLAEAADAYRCALAVAPHQAEIHNNLAIVLAAIGRFDEAIAAYRTALSLQPNYAAAHFNLGNSLRSLGRLDEAREAYRQALVIEPGDPDASNNLGHVLTQQGQLDEAVQHLRGAVAARPSFVEAHLNLSAALQQLGQADEAIVELQAALALQPAQANALVRLAGLQKLQGRLAESEATLRRLLAIQPDDASARASLGAVLQEQCRPDAALVEYGECARRAASPGAWPIKLATLLPPLYRSSEELIAWRGRIVGEVERLAAENFACDVTEQLAVAPFYTAYQGVLNRALHEQLARLYRVPQPADNLARPGDRGPRIRIGFLSRCFHCHTVGELTQGLISQLDRTRFEVEVFSVGRYFDRVARHIRQHADRYHELPAELPAARALLLERSLDLLFFPEIGMDPVTYTLAMSRLAPVQCVTWGHPDTTGLATVDYFLSSRDLEPPEAETQYSERLVRLGCPPVYYHRPSLTGVARSRADFGLAADAHVYGCLQSLFKFHPDFDCVLAEILDRDPVGILLLIGGRPAWEQILRDRLASAAPGTEKRIRFLPRLDQDVFLHCIACCDVLLDPLYFGGGNTSFQGLAMGVPIVTQPGPWMRSRVTTALYRQMEFDGCLATDCDRYVELAVRLGTDASARRFASGEILDRSHLLFENSASVSEFEEFLTVAVAGDVGKFVSS